MSSSKQCEYCGRTITGEPEIKILRGVEHIYCSDFCFKLDFYDVPTITFDDLQDMYKLRCVSVKLDYSSQEKSKGTK